MHSPSSPRPSPPAAGPARFPGRRPVAAAVIAAAILAVAGDLLYRSIADAYRKIEKPFDPTVLRELVNRLVGETQA
jgi:hypothetical protein